MLRSYLHHGISILECDCPRDDLDLGLRWRRRGLVVVLLAPVVMTWLGCYFIIWKMKINTRAH